MEVLGALLVTAAIVYFVIYKNNQKKNRPSGPGRPKFPKEEA